MSLTDLRGSETTGAQKVLQLLDALRQSQTGAVIYGQVERLLNDLSESQRTVELAYVNLINQLLGAYMGHLREGSPLQVEVRLLQARLQPPLTAADLQVLRDYVERYSSQIEALKRLDSELFQAAVEPLLATFGIVEGTPEAGEETLAAQPVRENSLTAASSADEEAPPTAEPVREADAVPPPRDWTLSEAPDSAQTGESDAEAGGAPAPAAVTEAAAEGVGAATPVDTAYRSHLDSKRRDIQKLQATLAQQVLGTIAQNEEFGVLLEVVLGELRQAGEVKELEDLRWTLIRETEKLTRGHHELAEKLDSTHHYLQLIESDSRRLSDELTRVRLLSLTDELTGLPNRRAFLRRIEDEVARVQRYGFPLSLALIDLDHFKQINDHYGHAGGDEVLQIYSKNILSIFRHHDLVARYGGEEFAVLLPNTDSEGSLRALTKVRERALEIRWKADGEMVPVPSFSAGVSLYKPGETAGAFIERADKALYRAKQLGRNRVEMDATYQSEADADMSGKRGKGTER
jgi:diguanylate cyclase (GGDEF)-like protein